MSCFVEQRLRRHPLVDSTTDAKTGHNYCEQFPSASIKRSPDQKASLASVSMSLLSENSLINNFNASLSTKQKLKASSFNVPIIPHIKAIIRAEPQWMGELEKTRLSMS